MSQPAAPVTAPLDTRNSGQLAVALTDQLSRLVKDEIALAQVDVKAAVAKLAAGGGMLAAAAVVGIAALVALLVGGGLGIALVLPSWLAALILGGGFLLLAGLLALVGLRAMKRGGSPVPNEAIDGLKLDVAIMKQVKP